MRPTWVAYAIATAVLLGSFTAAYVLPVSETFRGVLSVPGVGALVAALYQLLRDSTAHERALELQEANQAFTLGVSSHMANVAFDKHAAFAEEYMSCVTARLPELFQAGPTVTAMGIADDLQSIRAKHSAWLDEELENRLLPFERALRRLGADAGTAASMTGDARRAFYVNRMWESVEIHTCPRSV